MTGTAQRAVLAIVERAYRGAVEKQFADALYLAIELHRQMGGMDILLRGPAVSYAVADARTPPLRLGDRVVDTLSDPRGDVRRLMAAGARIYVDDAGLAEYGAAGRRLLDGVERLSAQAAAERWSDYRTVCFL